MKVIFAVSNFFHYNRYTLYMVSFMDVKYIGIHCMRKNGVYKQEEGHPYFIPTLTLNYLLQNMECSRRWTYADGENGRWGVAVKCNLFRIRIIHSALPHIMYSCRFKCSSGHMGDVLKNVDRLKDFFARASPPQVRKLVTLKSRLVPCWCITSYRGTLHFPIRYFQITYVYCIFNLIIFDESMKSIWSSFT